jgi:hypothetical protein
MANYLGKIYGPKDEEILLNFNPAYKKKEEVKVGLAEVFVAWMRSLLARCIIKAEG